MLIKQCANDFEIKYDRTEKLMLEWINTDVPIVLSQIHKDMVGNKPRQDAMIVGGYSTQTSSLLVEGFYEWTVKSHSMWEQEA